LSGPVAVGKSSAARLLAGLLAGLPFGIKAATVCTDGFLWPNHILEAQNMLARKGFPESYDNRALTGFLIDLRRGLPVQAPLYSHTAYDILPGQTQPVQGVQAVVVEGVNILGQAPLESGPRDLAPFFDCALYLDGPQPLVREWYLERFMALRKAALHQPNAYFARYAALDEAAALKQAQRIWETVNRPNLIQHIHPSRKNAHLVLEAQADHTIGSIHLKTQ
ncbi:MAG: type I pantothenate kinase, partial [Deltaproteobacteria bacterium]|nr:type I pantothenate kinase [Deltaproteobacteria bacterium]